MGKLKTALHAVVMGQGYVGLPLASELTDIYEKVSGFDVNLKRVEALNRGQSPISDLPDARLREMLISGYLATSDPSCISSADIVVICVPTPLDTKGEPDLRPLRSAVSLLDRTRRGTLIILESTSFPGTTEEVILQSLEASGKVLDSDFYLAFSPERVDPGNTLYSIRNTPRVVGGVSQKSARKATDFYGDFVSEVVTLSGAKEAEMAKLLENSYRLVNISLVNELSRLGREMGIDFMESIRGASSKPFGFEPFFPGPGAGGHCIPVDPRYLTFKAEIEGATVPTLIQRALEIDQGMAETVVVRAQELLHGALDRKRILIWGMSYKRNSSDLRESPGAKIFERLLQEASHVAFFDPHVDEITVGGRAHRTLSLKQVEAGSPWDLSILLQVHSVFQDPSIIENSSLVLDTRGSLKQENVRRL
jgi:nucleotide sugar dehydrogenase